MKSTKMRFAFSTLGCPDWPIERIASEASRMGYDGVEIRGIRRVYDLWKAEEFAPAAIERTRALFASAGVPIVQLDSSASFCWNDDAKLAAAYDEVARYVELARALGVPQVRIFGGEIPKGDTRAHWAPLLIERLKRAVEPAERGDVTLTIETHDTWARYENMAPIVAAVGSKRLVVLWDAGNGWAVGERFETAEQLNVVPIGHVHIKDMTSPRTYVPLGAGIIPLAHILELLRGIGYDGCVSLEWEKGWHPELAEPEVVFPAAIEFLRKATAGG